MFRAFTLCAENDVNFFYHDPEYDAPDELPEKRRLLRDFLALDPEGAGGPARDYWTGWGVTPAEPAGQPS